MVHSPQVVSSRPDSKECTFQPAQLFSLQQHRGVCITVVSCVFVYKARVGEG